MFPINASIKVNPAGSKTFRTKQIKNDVSFEKGLLQGNTPIVHEETEYRDTAVLRLGSG